MSKAATLAFRPVLFNQFRPALLLTLALLLCPGRAPADLSTPVSPGGEKKKATREPVRPPAQAVPLRVQVRRGGTITIPLRSNGAPGEQLRFRLRSLPEAGTVSAAEAVGEGTGDVAYTHSGSSLAATDRFTYAVQSSRGVSAPAEVVITILDDPPLLVVPESVSFGSVPAGGSATREFVIENRGGGLAAGALSVAEPFTVEPASYRLEAGEKATLTVTFTPESAEVSTRHLRFAGPPARFTALRGAGAAPFTVAPAKLPLEFVSGTRERAGTLAIVNNSPAAQTLTLRADPRLTVPAEVSVAPGETRLVPVSLPATDLAALEDSVVIEADRFSQTVAVSSPAVGPLLAISQPALDFGTASGGERPLAVRNDGGSTASVRVSTGAPFEVLAEDRAFTLEPGAAREMTIRLDPAAPPASYRVALVLETTGQRLEAQLTAAVPSPREANRTAPLHTPPPGAEPMPTASAASGRKIDVPIAGRLSVTSAGPHRAELLWETASNAGVRQRLYLRYPHGMRDGVFDTGWYAFPDVTGEPGPAGVKFRVTQLEPASGYIVCAMALDARGQPVQISPTAQIVTAAASGWLRITPLRILVALLLAMIVLVWLQRRVKPARAAP